MGEWIQKKGSTLKNKSLLLAVNHNYRNLQLLAQFLEREGYQVLTAQNLEAFEQALKSSQKIHLAIVDIDGYDRRIWDYFQLLKDEKISFFVIASQQSLAIQQQILIYGARTLLVKPLVLKELITVIRSLLSEQ